MEKLPDYYQLLHVQPDAPIPVIKASYRAMMQKMRLHPDLGGDESVAKQLNEAVTTLCDPELRAEYDLYRLTIRHSEIPQPGGTPTPEPQRSEQSTHRSKPSKSEDNETPERPAEEASESKTRPDAVHFPTRSKCPFCLASYPWVAGERNIREPRGYEGALSHCARCNGASTPIAAIPASSADDLRKIYRHELKSHVTLWTCWPADTPVDARMTDVSLAGCALLCETNVSVQSIIMLDTPLLNSICQVRYCKMINSDSHYAIGLEFLTLHIVAEPGSVFSATA